jgi:anthranilate synthase component 1
MIPKIQIPKKPSVKKVTFPLDVFDIFERLEHRFENCFLLESLTDSPESRYSIVGFDPELIVRGNRGSLTVGKKVYKTENPYAMLKKMFPQDVISRSFAGGLVGYVSYGAAEFFEPTLKLKQRPGYDRFRFGLYTDGLIFDKVTGETDYFYYRKNRLPEIQKMIQGPKLEAHASVAFKKSSLGKSAHAAIVRKVKEEIRQGNTFQTEVGLSAEYSLTGSLLPIYEKLRAINPSPHMYYIKFGREAVLGASPELLLDLTNGELQTFPLAGTVARGENAAMDQKLAKKLLSDPKERAEHVMLSLWDREGQAIPRCEEVQPCAAPLERDYRTHRARRRHVLGFGERVSCGNAVRRAEDRVHENNRKEREDWSRPVWRSSRILRFQRQLYIRHPHTEHFRERQGCLYASRRRHRPRFEGARRICRNRA